ncbi:hypothetical protein RSSM_04350 [Rhodopirellula sallentina SM41]|uniref:Uncharacterized protein n=1 Tax=Rhodopirellula sallentina SM41 TaxID=1263870 RepID=M5UDZ3_9BACT|nr:hypothetical protein RSSM_04350 [Rhodopirellula sallentina SM41]
MRRAGDPTPAHSKTTHRQKLTEKKAAVKILCDDPPHFLPQASR